jgi:TonB family protein
MLLIVVLLLFALAFRADKREITPDEAAKHLEKKVEPVLQEPNMCVRGDVILRVEIAEDGEVITIRAISGHPILRQFAIEAVRQWQYSPFLLKGKPIAVRTTVTVPFRKPCPREEAIQEKAIQKD